MLASSVLVVSVLCLPVSSSGEGAAYTEAVVVQHIQLAELSPEHQARMRGDMRELWSNMSPGDKAALGREHQERILENEPLVRPQRARYEEVDAGRYKQLSPDEHRRLRRQLRDLSSGEQ